MHFLKLALVASGAASIFMLHKVIVNNNIPQAALFLVVPFIIFAAVQLRRTVRCQECGISPFEDGFDDPDRALPVKFDYTRIGSGPIFRFYKLQLRLGMRTCAACTRNIREQTKPRG